MDYNWLLGFDGLTVIHGYRCFLNAKPYTVFNFDGYRRFLNFNNSAMNTANGNNFLPLLKAFFEFFLVF